jgi:hypothetical protein
MSAAVTILPEAAVQSVPGPSSWLGVLKQGPELEHGATAGNCVTECLPPGGMSVFNSTLLLRS